jgi:hypothetical protein
MSRCEHVCAVEGLSFFQVLERFPGQYASRWLKGWQLCETRLAFWYTAAVGVLAKFAPSDHALGGVVHARAITVDLEAP